MKAELSYQATIRVSFVRKLNDVMLILICVG